MRHNEKLKLIHTSGDELFPVTIKGKKSGKVAYQLAPDCGDKTEDLYETEDFDEALSLVLNKGYSIRCETLIATVKTHGGKARKRAGLYGLNKRSITGHVVKQ